APPSSKHFLPKTLGRKKKKTLLLLTAVTLLASSISRHTPQTLTSLRLRLDNLPNHSSLSSRFTHFNSLSLYLPLSHGNPLTRLLTTGAVSPAPSLTLNLTGAIPHPHLQPHRRCTLRVPHVSLSPFAITASLALSS
ncbi:hypothetical protein PIB30_087590, partial [Stylosanthes scabra]|nr:hypothetical protein [Stylosanthes scabra]